MITRNSEAKCHKLSCNREHISSQVRTASGQWQTGPCILDHTRISLTRSHLASWKQPCLHVSLGMLTHIWRNSFSNCECSKDIANTILQPLFKPFSIFVLYFHTCLLLQLYRLTISTACTCLCNVLSAVGEQFYVWLQPKALNIVL